MVVAVPMTPPGTARMCVYASKSHDIEFFNLLKNQLNMREVSLQFRPETLDIESADMAEGATAVCCFVNDDLSAPVLEKLHQLGVRYVLMRCAGFDRIDLEAAKKLGIRAARVPKYSPEAVAEFTIGLALAAIRRIPQASERCRRKNFSLVGQMGFDICGKTVGIIGTGFIGSMVARIFRDGFRANVIVYDAMPSDAMKSDGFKYVSIEEIYQQSHIISLHLPLLPQTREMLNKSTFAKMQDGVCIVNTSRGGLINNQDLIEAIKSKKVGSVALDVYQNEANMYFEDRSTEILMDDGLSILCGFPNVIISGHQAFFTREAMEQISTVTLTNIACFLRGRTEEIKDNIVV